MIVVKENNTRQLNEDTMITLADLAFDSDYNAFRTATVKCSYNPFSAQVNIGRPFNRYSIKGDSRNKTGKDEPSKVTSVTYRNNVVDIIITEDMEIRATHGAVMCFNKQMAISFFK